MKCVGGGGSGNPDDYFVLLDSVSGRPLRLVLAKLEGVLARVDMERTKRRGTHRAEVGVSSGASASPSSGSLDGGSTTPKQSDESDGARADAR